MSIKGAAEAVLPPPAQGWLKQAIYHRNCHLSPPQYRAALKHWYWLFKGRPCHLEAPRTMTEKIHWLKLYDSTPLKGRLADKFLVREWVADTVGEEYLVPLLGVWDSPDEIDFAPCRAASRSKPRTARGGTSSCRTRALLMRSGPVDASGSGSACVRR